MIFSIGKCSNANGPATETPRANPCPACSHARHPSRSVLPILLSFLIRSAQRFLLGNLRVIPLRAVCASQPFEAILGLGLNVLFVNFVVLLELDSTYRRLFPWVRWFEKNVVEGTLTAGVSQTGVFQTGVLKNDVSQTGFLAHLYHVRIFIVPSISSSITGLLQEIWWSR